MSKKKQETNWFEEVKGIALLIFAVLLFHSFVAKPFYIPSISMMPTLLVGDRLVVSKYPYGWSWVSPSFHIFPKSKGRVLGAMPERGDIVILTPKSNNSDYIKRVIGLPGDTFEMRNGQIFLNDIAVPQEVQPQLQLPIDKNSPCENVEFRGAATETDDGQKFCELNIIRETLPNGVSYDTIESGLTSADNVDPVKISLGHVYVLGDNRDRSADSRDHSSIGLQGEIPWENIGGRAEFTTFSLDGTTGWNPLTWLSSFRSGRSGISLRPDKIPETTQ